MVGPKDRISQMSCFFYILRFSLQQPLYTAFLLIITGCRVPRARRILRSMQRLHVLCAQFEIVHVGVLLDPRVRHGLGQRHESLRRKTISHSDRRTTNRQKLPPSANSTASTPAPASFHAFPPTLATLSPGISGPLRWDSTPR